MLAGKRGLAIPESSFASLEPCIPSLLTPGAAEALVMRVYRKVRTSDSTVDAVLRESLAEYQNPIAPEVMEFQIRTAVNEASALEFVPAMFRRKIS
jgi:hypothetical protein